MITVHRLRSDSQPVPHLSHYVMLLQSYMTQQGYYDGSEVNLMLMMQQEKQISRQSFQTITLALKDCCLFQS